MSETSAKSLLKRIGIIGGGPSGLFILKRLIEAKVQGVEIDIFERKHELGAGMPYSTEGAGKEHITNVSGNEIPEITTSLSDWMDTVAPEVLNTFNIDAEKFNDYKVLPRLLFGKYLNDQFYSLEKIAKKSGILLNIHRAVAVSDIVDFEEGFVTVVTEEGQSYNFNRVVICSGHNWPLIHEGKVKGYFDSPYPPRKLEMRISHPVAISGASLSAIDAVRTLARHNGNFKSREDGTTSYELSADSAGFKLVLHSRRGLLPAVRFHLEDSHLGKGSVLSKEDVEQNKSLNDGFLSLDFVFENYFKQPIKDKDPVFYEKIGGMQIEEFVDFVMTLRESIDPFDLFRVEYIEAEKSIHRKESIYWKEMLGVLSFVMNHPAKYFSAEDSLRLHKILHPLISIVIAYVPQTSVEEMLALHAEGLLELVPVGGNSYVEPLTEGGAVYHYTDSSDQEISKKYKTYIDATGQPHLSYDQLPFKSLVGRKTVSSAKLRFRDPEMAIKEKKEGNTKVIIDENGYYLNVPGIAINDNFQVLDEFGGYNDRIYMMAVPYIGGFNPDYSGLDFCEAASEFIVDSMVKEML